jgi:phosphoenolpyruvate-protein kinase (PTS system EI component)
MDLPSEGYQESIYRQVVETGSAQSVLRTIDIGSDKPVRYLPFPPETNPAMGFRSIRFALARPDVFEPQLRAMVRAAAGKPCRIIFPMVSTGEELLQLAELYSRVVDRVGVDRAPEWGIMVEVPSAMFMMEEIARHTRYISLGTNDLLQFFFGVDRTNERLAGLASPLSLPFLRLLFYGISTAAGEEVTVGICGEMASDPTGFLVLLGMGIREFSMRPSAIPIIRAMIPRIRARDLQQCVQELLAAGRPVDIAGELRQAFPELFPANETV